MFLFCIVFALGVGYIAYRGVNGTTGVNMAINIIQITALVVFSFIAIGYRVQPPARLRGLPPVQRHAGQLPGGAGQRHRRQRQTRPGHLGRQLAQDRRQGPAGL